MGSSNFVISLLGWTFIPDFATRHFLNFIYCSPIRIVTPAQPGSLQHRQHYTVAFGLVILSYLMYTLVQSSRAMPPNFYEILNVRPDVDENGLKLAFRTFAKRYHPDRVGPQGEELFMYVRDAFEALKDPVVRFAYDRFGPDAVAWSQHCRTTREFLKRGLMVSSGYHLVTGIALLFWSAIGKPSVVSFWRYVLFALLFAAELSFILSSFPATPTSIFQPPNSFPNFLSFSISIPRPTSFSIFQRIWPNRVPYQHILFLHQLFMFLSVALTRVVPQFISLLNGGEESRRLEPLELALWERIYGTIAIADREASVLLHTILQSIKLSNTNKPYHNPTLAAMHPVSPHEAIETLDRLTPEMHAMAVEANIKNHDSGPISSAWRAALSSKRNFNNQLALSGDQGTPSTPVVKQEAQRTPNHILKKDFLDRTESIDRVLENTSSPGGDYASDSGNPRARRGPFETRSPARRSSFGPSAGEC